MQVFLYIIMLFLHKLLWSCLLLLTIESLGGLLITLWNVQQHAILTWERRQLTPVALSRHSHNKICKQQSHTWCVVPPSTGRAGYSVTLNRYGVLHNGIEGVGILRWDNVWFYHCNCLSFPSFYCYAECGRIDMANNVFIQSKRDPV